MLPKIETCSWRLLSKNKNSQLTVKIAFLMEVISAFLKFHTRRWYEGYSILRFSLQYVIWWRQLPWREGCAPDLTTRLGWSVKMRSILGEELGNMCVGSITNCFKPHDEVRTSIWIPSSVLVSKAHHDLERAL